MHEGDLVEFKKLEDTKLDLMRLESELISDNKLLKKRLARLYAPEVTIFGAEHEKALQSRSSAEHEQ